MIIIMEYRLVSSLLHRHPVCLSASSLLHPAEREGGRKDWTESRTLKTAFETVYLTEYFTSHQSRTLPVTQTLETRGKDQDYSQYD